MNTPKQLAKHYREFYFGGNWTWSNLKDQLIDVTWEEALSDVHGMNSIATLANHIHYYSKAQAIVFEGGRLEAQDALSFAHADILDSNDWKGILDKMWSEAEHYATLLEALPEESLWMFFEDEKYGIFFRNILGMIEHGHYHLGQIALIKKIIRNSGQ